MNDDHGNCQIDEASEQERNLDALLTALKNNPIDVGWLSEYDMGMVETCERYMAYQAARCALDDDPLADERDIDACGRSVGGAGSALFAALSHADEDADLFVLLTLACQGGYEAGVRDAVEGRISSGYARGLAAKTDRADLKRAAMYGFHRDISGL